MAFGLGERSHPGVRSLLEFARQAIGVPVGAHFAMGLQGGAKKFVGYSRDADSRGEACAIPGFSYPQVEQSTGPV